MQVIEVEKAFPSMEDIINAVENKTRIDKIIIQQLLEVREACSILLFANMLIPFYFSGKHYQS